MSAQTTAAFNNFTTALMESGDPYAMAAGAAAKAVAQIVSSLGIGTGRNEADRIVPYQNQLNALLVTANNAMSNASVPADRLLQIRAVVVESTESFRVYIQDSAQFPDGRASRQAYDTMLGSPGYARVTIENLDKTIQERGGPLGSIQAATGVSSGTLMIGAAILLALLLLK